MLSREELEEIRSEILKIAAACARFQHVEIQDLTAEDVAIVGDYAQRLKKVSDRLQTA